MAVIVAIGYKPGRLVDGLAALAGLLIAAGSLAASGAPALIRLVAAVAGLLVAVSALARLVAGPRLSRSLEDLAASARLEGDELVLPRRLRLRPGVIVVETRLCESGWSRTEVFVEFRGSGGVVAKERLRPSDFKGDGRPWQGCTGTLCHARRAVRSLRLDAPGGRAHGS